MHDFLIPQMSSVDHASFQDDMVMHYYMTGSAFERMQETHLLQAMRKLCPDVRMPTRKELCGRLLNKAPKKVAAKVEK